MTTERRRDLMAKESYQRTCVGTTGICSLSLLQHTIDLLNHADALLDIYEEEEDSLQDAHIHPKHVRAHLPSLAIGVRGARLR